MTLLLNGTGKSEKKKLTEAHSGHYGESWRLATEIRGTLNGTWGQQGGRGWTSKGW